MAQRSPDGPAAFVTALHPVVPVRAPPRRAPAGPAAPFPFPAIVGQAAMRQALLLTAIDPLIGGVLVMGDRGTGKSTIVRGLASLLPTIEVVAGCPYGCAPGSHRGSCPHCAQTKGRRRAIRVPVPVVDLPLGATEDRLVGALDLERALRDGVQAFEPGLLARANRGYLYIDEVNLLDDHLVDLLLDAAASGEHVVEREGLSVRHPARFVLIGSGNPEEGDLRPQLLDRFGLAIEVRTPGDPDERLEVLERRLAYDADPAGFAAAWEPEQMRLREAILAARAALPSVETPREIARDGVALCAALGTDGLRGELTLLRAGRVAAALAGRTRVERADLREVAQAALSHRLRRDPLDEAGSAARVARAVREALDG